MSILVPKCTLENWLLNWHWFFFSGFVFLSSWWQRSLLSIWRYFWYVNKFKMYCYALLWSGDSIKASYWLSLSLCETSDCKQAHGWVFPYGLLNRQCCPLYRQHLPLEKFIEIRLDIFFILQVRIMFSACIGWLIDWSNGSFMKFS